MRNFFTKNPNHTNSLNTINSPSLCSETHHEVDWNEFDRSDAKMNNPQQQIQQQSLLDSNNPYLNNESSDVQIYICEWINCVKNRFEKLDSFLDHLREHGQNVQIADDRIICEWADCTDEFELTKAKEFQLHLSYHGYHSKLMSTGALEIKKISSQIQKSVRCYIDSSARTVLPVLPDSFICGWQNCFEVFHEAEIFYRHVEKHPFAIEIPKDVPRQQAKTVKFATCKWNDCEFQTNSRWHLKDHLRSHTQEKLIACPNCGSMFCSKFKLGDHILRQYLNENFTNEHLQTLLLHVSNDQQQVLLTLINPQVSNEKEIENSDRTVALAGSLSNLSTSGGGGSNNSSLNGHKAITNFSSNSTNNHSSFNEDNQPTTSYLNRDEVSFSTALGQFKCDNCDKICATKSLLREHAKSHSESYIYQCELCSFKSPSPSGILHHKKYRHSDERPFNCQFCDAKFKSKSDLRKHIDIHSSEHPYKCSMCEFECRCCHTLNRHLKLVHENTKQVYECHLCEKKFTRGNNLSRHLTKNHKLVIPDGKTRFTYKRANDGAYRVSLNQ